MLEVPNQVESKRKLLTVSAALEEVLDDARMYPDPESFARLLEALAGSEATPGDTVLNKGWPTPCAGIWHRPTEEGGRRFIRELDFAEALAEALAGKVRAPDVVAEVYAVTMGVRAVPGVDAAGEPGLGVDTEMRSSAARSAGTAAGAWATPSLRAPTSRRWTDGERKSASTSWRGGWCS
jgi:hypothetical protein